MEKPVARNRHFHQGKYIPKNKNKYIGNWMNIIYRSGWERNFLIWCDMNPNILRWGSEELVIPYVSPIDNQIHRYYIDFIMETKNINTGKIQKFAVEIKPYAQTIPPKKKRILTEKYQRELLTFAVNMAKWNAAKAFCQQQNINFIVLTEKQLFKKHH